MAAKKEIERKFKLKRMFIRKGKKFFDINNCLKGIVPDIVQQGYVFRRNGEFRAKKKRKAGTKTYSYSLGIKSDGDLERDEFTAKIHKFAFDILWSKTKGKRLEKVVYHIPHKKHVLELDFFKGNHEGLIILECEFKSHKESKKFVLPEWAKSAKEVTYNPKYKNKNLAC